MLTNISIQAENEALRQQLQVMEQRLRDALADTEAHRQQLEQQLQEANARNQVLSANLQQTQDALTAIRRALDVAPGSGAAAAPIGGSNSGATPAPNGVKRDRMSEEQIDTLPPRRASKRVKEESSDEGENIENLRNCEEIIELSD